MSDKEAVRLAHHIILDHFGPLVAQVAHPLLHRGRLSLQALCSLAKVAPRPARAALLVLMQHGLLWWTGEQADPPESYEINVKAIMDLVRVGRVVEMAQKAWGPTAADVVYFLLSRGKAKLPEILGAVTATVLEREKDLERARNRGDDVPEDDERSDNEDDDDAPSSSSKAKKDKKGKRRKGDDDEDEAEAVSSGKGLSTKKMHEKISAKVLALIKSHHIIPFSPSQLVSPRDKLITWRKEELAKIKGVIAQKARNEAHEAASNRIRDERDGWFDISNVIKSKNSITKSKSKKAKTDFEVEYIDEDVYLFVNFDKFTIRLRDELIVKAASDRFNKQAGAVIESILQSASSGNILQAKSEPITVHQILQNLPDDAKLHKGIFDPSAEAKRSSKPSKEDAKAAESERVQAFCSLLACEDNPTAAGQLSQFISRVKTSRDSSGSYSVEYEIICRRLKRRVLDAVVRERWGDEAARVLTVVLKHQKMDEKHISKVAMLAPKDVRVITASLSSASLLELQEVPKGADRLPARTFYLWHVDLARAYTALISHLYKTMANLAQRREHELKEHAAVVEKRNRTDVRESGGELLSEQDKTELAALDATLEKLTLAEQRTDVNVFILRDLPGGPVGMLDGSDV